MIVNGRDQFVGSDEDALQKALGDISAPGNISITKLDLVKNDAGTSAAYTLSGDIKGYHVNIAVVSKHESTYVKRGENGGRTLPHINVVKDFYTVPAATSGIVDLGKLPDDAANTLVIAYIQRSDDMRIMTAAEAQP